MLNIRELYSYNQGLIYFLNKCAKVYHQQNYDMGVRLTKDYVTRYLNVVLNNIFEEEEYFNENFQIVDKNKIINLLERIMQTQKEKDYIAVADLYEEELLPFCIKIQNIIQIKEGFFYDESLFQKNILALKNKNPNLAELLCNYESDKEDDYRIGFATSGDITMAINDNTGFYYIHSSINPALEAEEFIRHYYDVEKEEYIIYGFGLGYHINALLVEDDGVKIEIYENDLQVLKLAFTYLDYTGLIEYPLFELYYTEKFSELSDRLSSIDLNKTSVILHHPSVRHIVHLEIKETLEKFFIQDAAIKNQKQRMLSNFRCNKKNYNEYVDELRTEFKDKNLIIVAAGPSLDRNIEQLVHKPNNTIILAASTVIKKLINLKIFPDYIIVIDSNQRVSWHIRGVEDKNIPILLLATAEKYFSNNCSGKKYLICQKEVKEVEKYAIEKNYHLYNTGGSVSTTALDIGIQLGCKRIIFIGLDLAYTDNKAHTVGIPSSIKVTSTEDMLKIKALGGGKVFASKVFCIYREWIEKRIKEEQNKGSNVEFIDATEGGALIKGMKIMNLKDSIKLCQEV